LTNLGAVSIKLTAIFLSVYGKYTGSRLLQLHRPPDQRRGMMKKTEQITQANK